jgi:hypothetical protein
MAMQTGPLRRGQNRAASRFPSPTNGDSAKASREYEHLIINTAARQSAAELADLVAGCDLLIVPTTPDALSLAALMQTVEALPRLGAERYRVLLTIVPPAPSRGGEEARTMLAEAELPVFAVESGTSRHSAKPRCLAGSCRTCRIRAPHLDGMITSRSERSLPDEQIQRPTFNTPNFRRFGNAESHSSESPEVRKPRE